MASNDGKIGILVGGGPAPGINSVIAAASIRGIDRGYDILGIFEGFRWLMQGDTSHVQKLTIDAVSRIHFRGGSELATARDNPTKDPKHLDNVVKSLWRLGIDKLITIGGDDTAFSALKLEEHAGGDLRVVHVPKTIDNDLDLPHGTCTFGYQTARHVGAELVKNLMVDARATTRWFLAISMGRKAGHLALGIGKAAGATVTIVPEEFPDEKIRMKHIVDILSASIIKRLADGRRDGVAVLAEGLMERLDPEDLRELETAARDEHDHIRLGEIQFAAILKDRLKARLKELNVEATTVTTLDIGYELRGAAPIPFDMEYTRDLGFCAAQFITNGGTAAMVSIVNGHFKPLYFNDIIDPATNRTRVRMVDVESEYYHIARRYMLRLNKLDFENRVRLAAIAGTCGMTPDQFVNEFYYLIEEDLMNKKWLEHKGEKPATEDVTTMF